MTSVKRIAWGMGALVVGGALYLFVSQKSGARRAGAGEPEPTPAPAGEVRLSAEAARLADIKTTVVHRGPAASNLLLSGTCQVDQERVAKVTALVSGRIARLRVSPGRRVSAGETLAVIGSVELAEARRSLTEAVAAGSVARAQMGIAAARLASARVRLDRQREFERSGAFAQKPVEDARSQVASADAEVRTLESDLDRAQSELTRTQELLRSEIVARRDLEVAQADVRSARARLDSAAERARIARVALSREEDVSRRNLLNRREVEDAEAEVRGAVAEVEAARVASRNAERAAASVRSVVASLGAPAAGDAAALTIRAPISGVILDRTVTPGQSVERGAEICEIADVSSIWVIGNAYEKDLSRLRVGQAVSVSVAAFPGVLFHGSLENLDTLLDEKSRTVRVRCRLPNPAGRLRPGMFAQLTVVVSRREAAVLAPDSAVQEEGGTACVYVVRGDAFRRTAVRLGEESGGMREVLAGLRDGDRVVTDGSFILKSESMKSQMEGD